jgi:hypothetical protein
MMLLADGFSGLAVYMASFLSLCSSCHFFSSWLFKAPRKRLSMPREKRNKIVKKYVAGVVVVQFVNHNVTRILDEKVDDMADIASIGGMGPADGIGKPIEEDGDIPMFILAIKSWLLD